MVKINEKYLNEFAYLGDKAYLDVAFVAMQPKRTLDLCAEFQREFVRSLGDMCNGKYAGRRDVVRRSICSLINAEPDEIMFTPNTSYGNSILPACYKLNPGDSVVLSNYDYSSLVYGFYKLREKGINVKTVRPKRGIVSADDMIAAIDDTTRVVVISHVNNTSGYLADVEKLGRECRRRGIVFGVDGIQALGRIPLDVKKSCIDVYSCGGFKSLLGVFGTGFVYCDKRIIPSLEPTVWSNENLIGFEDDYESIVTAVSMPYTEDISRLDGGSENNYGIAAMGSSIELLLEIGIENIYTHIMELEDALRARIAELKLPIEPFGDGEASHRSGLVCYSIDRALVPALEAAFLKRGIYATVRDEDGIGLLRISLHYYNTMEHIERAISVLKEVYSHA